MTTIEFGEIEEATIKLKNGKYIYLRGGKISSQVFKDIIKFGFQEIVKKVDISFNIVGDQMRFIFADKKWRSDKIKRKFEKMDGDKE